MKVTFFLLLVNFFLWGCAGNQVTDDDPTIAEGEQTEQGNNFSSNRDGNTEEQDAIIPRNDLSAEEDTQKEDNEVDPNENFNRSMYGFNQYFDAWFASPISTAYLWLLPEFGVTGVANVFSNMQGINVFLNDFLQGKFKQGGLDTSRFLLNTTVGLAGLFDVATYVGLEKHDEDFDQTLAVWGVPTGAYLVLPFIGPFTYRGIPGAVFDLAANPITYLPLGVAALGAVNTRANAEGALQFIDEAALDPYIFTRESFLQWREYLASDGSIDLTDDVDYFDDEFDDEFDEEFDDEFDADLDDEAGQLDLDNGIPVETEEIQAETEGSNGRIRTGSE